MWKKMHTPSLTKTLAGWAFCALCDEMEHGRADVGHLLTVARFVYWCSEVQPWRSLWLRDTQFVSLCSQQPLKLYTARSQGLYKFACLSAFCVTKLNKLQAVDSSWAMCAQSHMKNLNKTNTKTTTNTITNNNNLDLLRADYFNTR